MRIADLGEEQVFVLVHGLLTPEQMVVQWKQPMMGMVTKT
jgi:hypothetical protein